MLRSSASIRRSVRTSIAAVLVALVVAGCGGAYAQAIARGDKFAASGMWDEAAAAYEQAQKIDPEDGEAGIKLKQARKKQADERLAKGKSLIARGEIASGLAAILDAVKLDPDSTAAQAALADANAEAVREAEELLEKGEGRKAFELTTLVLQGSPRDPRAKRLDGRIRDELAEASYTRAADFEKRGKLGNALVELAACLEYRPDYRDARLRVGGVKLALEQELVFYVVLERFADTTTPHDLAQVLSVDLLSQSFDPKIPLRVVDKLPPGKASPRGVRLSGTFEGYRFAHDKDRVSRSCDYQCGIDRVPNPNYESTERRVAQEERELIDHEKKADEYQKEVDRYQKDVDYHQKDVDRYTSEVDKYRAELDKCQDAKKPGDSSSSCSSEESRLRSAQSSLDSARSRQSSPKSYLESARRKLDDAHEDVRRSREDLSRVKQELAGMNRINEVPRMCPHNYTSTVHTLAAEVTVRMTAEQLQDKTKLLDNQPFPYNTGAKDETFDAQPGRCSEVSGGDPLTLPSEKEVKIQLVTQAIRGVREKVMTSYDRHRQRFLADARREESSGLAEEAVEAYVRYLLSGPKSIDPKDQKQIGEFLARTKGFGKIDTLPGL
ncbi:hypothetical protein [Polyangium aurulentum]|uniref:hypothetical protein n=1 Tax=Polyangium aurulentum TaxID=2567896 RepID=UPI0010ADB0FB|nr:hypothetical protein [Polyangium aurulentum]UQA54729.1 hypothetical protein E8A73_025490 [Polyangium aurulentum]